ncbi:MAG TPA: BrnA antitoxin family protein [Verrucomicrobiae bacterium]|jgi:uncharacterized protein (DUF4415 family)|nr:BrnA antitoxin family protein [Verrucomicrobiae bacterium]
MKSRKPHGSARSMTGKSGSARSTTSKRRGAPPKRERKSSSLQGMRISDFYRPLKRPITLRIDADVLAWFKKDGRRYQTRINQALRTVMEKELKEAKRRFVRSSNG